MKRVLLAATALAAMAPGVHGARASSHREAPGITQTPKLDATDFYMFRSYQQGRAGYTTLIADYQPFQRPYGGPNFFNLDPNAIYDINIDNTGRSRPSFAFRFRINVTNQNLALNIGGKTVPIPLINDAPVSSTDTSGQNVFQTYTLSYVKYGANGAVETPITNTAGGSVFSSPLDYIGKKSIADYESYAHGFIFEIAIPNCAMPGKVFVGQRHDPFVVNLGETFDLINYANPVGEQYANTVKNSLASDNVTALALEVPTQCLVNGTDPVIGGWTTASTVLTGKAGNSKVTQVSRLGMPLVNELVIGLPDKDKFNASVPADDGQFINYVNYPTLPALIQALFGTAAPVTPRPDLVATFLTGLAGVNQPAHQTTPGEELRLNTSIAPTPVAQQNRLGVIGNPALGQPGDLAGYPNGRRPGDDVVDISLRVVMGRLFTLGLFGSPGDAPSGALDFTDGALSGANVYNTAFPYLTIPKTDSPVSANGQ